MIFGGSICNDNFSSFYLKVWLITTEPQYQVHLMFMTFETERDFDLVRIGQGDNPFSSASVYFEWSGVRVSPPIRSTDNALWVPVQLTSDGSIFKDGFELTVTSVIASPGMWSN
jgi:hypothetical protein